MQYLVEKSCKLERGLYAIAGDVITDSFVSTEKIAILKAAGCVSEIEENEPVVELPEPDPEPESKKKSRKKAE